jgi:hypothetical protein
MYNITLWQGGVEGLASWGLEAASCNLNTSWMVRSCATAVTRSEFQARTVTPAPHGAWGKATLRRLGNSASSPCHRCRRLTLDGFNEWGDPSPDDRGTWELGSKPGPSICSGSQDWASPVLPGRPLTLCEVRSIVELTRFGDVFGFGSTTRAAASHTFCFSEKGGISLGGCHVRNSPAEWAFGDVDSSEMEHLSTVKMAMLTPSAMRITPTSIYNVRFVRR